MLQAINSATDAPQPIGPYSQAIRVQGLVFCAGQIGLDPRTGKMISGDITDQTKRVLDNLKAVLEASASSLNHVVMTSVFLADIGYAPAVNEVYRNYVSTEHPPARQTMAVKDLPLGALVEISMIATVK